MQRYGERDAGVLYGELVGRVVTVARVDAFGQLRQPTADRIVRVGDVVGVPPVPQDDDAGDDEAVPAPAPGRGAEPRAAPVRRETELSERQRHVRHQLGFADAPLPDMTVPGAEHQPKGRSVVNVRKTNQKDEKSGVRPECRATWPSGYGKASALTSSI